MNAATISNRVIELHERAWLHGKDIALNVSTISKDDNTILIGTVVFCEHNVTLDLRTIEVRSNKTNQHWRFQGVDDVVRALTYGV